MRANIERRRGEGNGGFIVVLIVGAIILFFLSKTPEGKHALNKVAAAVQSPVQVSLTPFLIMKGYYVNIKNTSTNSTLTEVTVTYTGSSGNSKTQTVDTLRPGETKTLDPSSIQWAVAKHETISVSVSGNFIPKVIETNILINK